MRTEKQKIYIFVKKDLKNKIEEHYIIRDLAYVTAKNKKDAIEKFKKLYSNVTTKDVYILDNNPSRVIILSDY